MVKAPATRSGSPVATYAAISSSEMSAKCTVVEATSAASRPVRVSTRQCPVRRTPLRPRIRRHRATASAASAGLPSASPSRSSTESQPSTSTSVAAGRHRHRLADRQRERDVVRRAGDVVLVDPADDDLGLDAGLPQEGEPGGGGGGQDEAPGHGRPRYDPPDTSLDAVGRSRHDLHGQTVGRLAWTEAPAVVELYTRAADRFAAAVAAVPADGWTAPTPCVDWDVRTLVNHVVGEDRWVPPLVDGRTIAEVGDALDGDLLGTGPADAAASAGQGCGRGLRRARCARSGRSISPSANFSAEEYAMAGWCRPRRAHLGPAGGVRSATVRSTPSSSTRADRLVGGLGGGLPGSRGGSTAGRRPGRRAAAGPSGRLLRPGPGVDGVADVVRPFRRGVGGVGPGRDHGADGCRRRVRGDRTGARRRRVEGRGRDPGRVVGDVQRRRGTRRSRSRRRSSPATGPPRGGCSRGRTTTAAAATSAGSTWCGCATGRSPRSSPTSRAESAPGPVSQEGPSAASHRDRRRQGVGPGATGRSSRPGRGGAGSRRAPRHERPGRRPAPPGPPASVRRARPAAPAEPAGPRLTAGCSRASSAAGSAAWCAAPAAP